MKKPVVPADCQKSSQVEKVPRIQSAKAFSRISKISGEEQGRAK